MERIRVMSRCLGEIYGFLPGTGEFYSSINRSGAAGRRVRSRRAAYVWSEYAEGMSRRLIGLCRQVEGGVYMQGKIGFAGYICRWDASEGAYITDIDEAGRATEVRHGDIYSAVGCLLRGGDAAMRRRMEKTTGVKV
ncbi:MAG: hypothetical protein K2K09_07970 [Lachnospiraceae bacterium]|nr:hypothetical protein [Lachnospiraceae bacterium]